MSIKNSADEAFHASVCLFLLKPPIAATAKIEKGWARVLAAEVPAFHRPFVKIT
jgi:hypothetical protein